MPSLHETKRCRRCGQVKPLAFFPKDHSRPDGRWHTCKACNRTYSRTRGKELAAMRKAEQQAERQSRQGLSGLKQYSHPGDRFSSQPPELRSAADYVLSRSRTRHRHRMTPWRYAALVANAASNALRVGNSSWARSMLRKKGYRRAERRRAEQEAQLRETRAHNAGKARVAYLPIA